MAAISGIGVPEIAVLVVIVVLVSFPISMLINCLSAPKEQFHSRKVRAIWAVVIVLGAPIGVLILGSGVGVLWALLGALIYFFAVFLRRPRKTEGGHEKV